MLCHIDRTHCSPLIDWLIDFLIFYFKVPKGWKKSNEDAEEEDAEEIQNEVASPFLTARDQFVSWHLKSSE